MQQTWLSAKSIRMVADVVGIISFSLRVCWYCVVSHMSHVLTEYMSHLLLEQFAELFCRNLTYPSGCFPFWKDNSIRRQSPNLTVNAYIMLSFSLDSSLGTWVHDTFELVGVPSCLVALRLKATTFISSGISMCCSIQNLPVHRVSLLPPEEGERCPCILIFLTALC